MTAVRWLTSWWRRSLQARVVVTTLVVSATVTVLIGITVLDQVRSGLLDSASRSALGQLSNGTAQAQRQFAALPSTSVSSIERTAYDVVKSLSGRSDQDGAAVSLLSATPGLRGYTPGQANADIPRRLRDIVSNQSRQAWTYTTVTQSNGDRVPGLVAGAPVQAGSVRYELYYVFPLSRQAETLNLVERTMLFAGLALVVLLVGIAALVARQVVRPVRQAAVTAERLAAGQLKERMAVHGEDDLARLAASFNRMADTVQQQISQLRELSRLQRRFVADVSHELRTPITTIRMAADLMHDASADLPPELARSSELLQTQLGRFEALLSDLLEISRHDAGAAVLEVEPTDLRQLVAGVVDARVPVAARNGTTIVTDLPDAAVIVEVDPRRIDRVLRNLVDNAIGHANGQPVEVRLRGDDGGVAVAVRDHGVGLRPGDASLVFGRFWRADPARARTHGGSGLGLSIALEDTRLHGGWLQAWGEPDRGSVFRLTLPWRIGEPITRSPLPLNPADAVEPAQPAEPEPSRAGS
ncbi:MAG TPA: MtrAB system histidine kinase MtrB [Mycobacteriales bacterium]|nr:MtrAB system histidine kinase MtrB [Mycobacteriales bacterium]